MTYNCLLASINSFKESVEESGLKSNENVSIFMQSEYNLTKSAGWKIEVTTLEDLMLNYGYNY